ASGLEQRPTCLVRCAARLLRGGLRMVHGGQAVAGPYTFEVDTGAETFTTTATLTSLDTLPYPTGVTVESHSPTVVVGSWDAHPEAVSYTAALFAGTYDAPTQVAFAHTAATEHTLSGLQLEPGQCFLAVYAYPVDRTAPHRLMPPARFDVALDASGYFQVEEAALSITWS